MSAELDRSIRAVNQKLAGEIVPELESFRQDLIKIHKVYEEQEHKFTATNKDVVEFQRSLKKLRVVFNKSLRKRSDDIRVDDAIIAAKNEVHENMKAFYQVLARNTDQLEKNNKKAQADAAAQKALAQHSMALQKKLIAQQQTKLKIQNQNKLAQNKQHIQQAAHQQRLNQRQQSHQQSIQNMQAKSAANQAIKQTIAQKKASDANDDNIQKRDDILQKLQKTESMFGSFERIRGNQMTGSPSQKRAHETRKVLSGDIPRQAVRSSRVAAIAQTESNNMLTQAAGVKQLRGLDKFEGAKGNLDDLLKARSSRFTPMKFILKQMWKESKSQKSKLIMVNMFNNAIIRPMKVGFNIVKKTISKSIIGLFNLPFKMISGIARTVVDGLSVVGGGIKGAVTGKGFMKGAGESLDKIDDRNRLRAFKKDEENNDRWGVGLDKLDILLSKYLGLADQTGLDQFSISSLNAEVERLTQLINAFQSSGPAPSPTQPQQTTSTNQTTTSSPLTQSTTGPTIVPPSGPTPTTATASTTSATTGQQTVSTGTAAPASGPTPAQQLGFIGPKQLVPDVNVLIRSNEIAKELQTQHGGKFGDHRQMALSMARDERADLKSRDDVQIFNSMDRAREIAKQNSDEFGGKPSDYMPFAMSEARKEEEQLRSTGEIKQPDQSLEQAREEDKRLQEERNDKLDAILDAIMGKKSSEDEEDDSGSFLKAGFLKGVLAQAKGIATAFFGAFMLKSKAIGGKIAKFFKSGKLGNFFGKTLPKLFTKMKPFFGWVKGLAKTLGRVVPIFSAVLSTIEAIMETMDEFSVKSDFIETSLHLIQTFTQNLVTVLPGWIDSIFKQFFGIETKIKEFVDRLFKIPEEIGKFLGSGLSDMVRGNVAFDEEIAEKRAASSQGPQASAVPTKGMGPRAEMMMRTKLSKDLKAQAPVIVTAPPVNVSTPAPTIIKQGSKDDTFKNVSAGQW